MNHWITATGQKIAIKELGDDHIKNILSFIKRTGVGYDQISQIKAEIADRNKTTHSADDYNKRMFKYDLL